MTRKITLAAVLACASAFAQQTLNTVPAGSTVVDGSVNPLAIPDAVALRLVFGNFGKPTQPQASSITQSSSAAQSYTLTAKQQSKLQRWGLSKAETATFLAEVVLWFGELDAAKVPGGSWYDFDGAATTHLANLQTKFSQPGWNSFHSFLVGEKVNMKLVLVPAGAHQH
jgi:hypothetical protein